MSFRRVVLGLGGGLLLGGFGLMQFAQLQQEIADDPARWWDDGLTLRPHGVTASGSVWRRRGNAIRPSAASMAEAAPAAAAPASADEPQGDTAAAAESEAMNRLDEVLKQAQASGNGVTAVQLLEAMRGQAAASEAPAL